MKKLLFILAITLAFASCNKEEGCMNPTATNFNAEAEKDDGSCQFITSSEVAQQVAVGDPKTDPNDTTTVVVTDTVTVTTIDTIKLTHGDGVTDIDGNAYSTVIIGSQEIMATNLRVTRYTDGTNIVNLEDNLLWLNTTNPAMCYYNNDKAFSESNVYGVLYNQHAAMSDKICPSGFHVPSSAEYGILSTYISDQGYTTDAYDWLSDYGFNAKLSGGRFLNNIDTTSMYIKESTNFMIWTSTSGFAINIAPVNHSDPNYIQYYPYNQGGGFAVRCFKD